jgi:hypothetical protein
VDIPDTRIVFGSAVRCEMVMGSKVNDSKRREDVSYVRRVVNAINHPRKWSGNWCKGRTSIHVPLREHLR